VANLYVWSGAAGSGSGADWTNAKTTLTTAFVTEAAGDTLFVAHDHAESTASAVTLTSSGTASLPTKVICVNRAGSVPPVSADRLATAQVATSANNNITFAGFTHYDGIIFIAGNSTGTANIQLSAANAALRFDNCSLRCGSSGATSKLLIGGTTGGAGTAVEFNNTTVSFAHASQTIQIAGLLKWCNTPSALLGTIPNELFIPSALGGGGYVECIGVDFSAAGSGKTIAGTAGVNSSSNSFMFIDCKLNASVTASEVPFAPGENLVDFVRSGASGVNYTVRRHRFSGLLVEETTIVRSGGASDGTTPIAWKITTTGECTYSMPFECPPIAIWNDTDGSAVTATVEGIWSGGVVPKDDEVWLEVEYLGDNSSPQGSFVSDGKADLLTTAANQTSSSETWGGSTTKFKLACNFTPQQVGWIYARVRVGKASTTAYIDPLVTLS
jgi:hypothetical protein